MIERQQVDNFNEVMLMLTSFVTNTFLVHHTKSRA